MTKGRNHISKFFLLAARLVREGVLPTFMAAPTFICGCSGGLGTESEPVKIYVEVGEAVSKAPSWWLVRRLDIFTFNADDGIIDSWQCNLSHISNGVSALSGQGSRMVAVIANMDLDKDLAMDIRSYEDLARLETALASDSPEYPIMSGTASFVSGKDKSCTVKLTPVLCEIDVSLKCRFGGGWRGSVMEDVQVFLTGVSGRAAVMEDSGSPPTEILNSGGLSEYDLQRLSYPLMLCRPIGRIKDTDGSKSVYASLYAYPNGVTDESVAAPYTRLVVEGTVDGHRWFYPIPLKGLRRNTRYAVSLTISGEGSGEPYIDVSLETNP